MPPNPGGKRKGFTLPSSFTSAAEGERGRGILDKGRTRAGAQNQLASGQAVAKVGSWWPQACWSVRHCGPGRSGLPGARDVKCYFPFLFGPCAKAHRT